MLSELDYSRVSDEIGSEVKKILEQNKESRKEASWSYSCEYLNVVCAYTVLAIDLGSLYAGMCVCVYVYFHLVTGFYLRDSNRHF